MNSQAPPRSAPDLSVIPTLVGERTVLRPFTPADLPRISAIVREPEVGRLTGAAGVVFDDERLRTFYARAVDAPDRLDLAITDRADGRLVGEAALYEWDARNRGCVFRILVGAAGRGRGIGTEATELIVGHAFGRLGMHRVALEVLPFNTRARHVYEKLGFVVEGRRRASLFQDGVWVDWVTMSVLAPEWRAGRTSLVHSTGTSQDHP
ncbi:GNAT family N-acetyltransferase [Streptomyces sp. NPDC007088]|uniref:GNAT family N-acetyltransferase n=1 Tax=Streptomyces sp. NPDC007088 TaxID=3364773 RepID=UPI0036C69C6A